MEEQEQEIGIGGSIGSRRAWQQSETLALLDCYREHKHEFQISRKKKYAYQNILNDLVSRGVLENETTIDMIINKIKSLMRAYKNAKKNEEKYGLETNLKPLMRKFEEVFGNQQNETNVYDVYDICSLDVSETTCDQIIKEEEEENEVFPLEDYSLEGDNLMISNVHSLNLSGAPTKALHNTLEIEVEPFASKTNINKVKKTKKIPEPKSSTQYRYTECSGPTKRPKKIKFTKKFYLKEKLKLEKQALKEKIKYRKRKEANEQKRHEELMNLLRVFVSGNSLLGC